MSSNEDFLRKLLLTFKIEAEEHITAISYGLIQLEKDSLLENQKKNIEIVLREVHSLKGAARSVNILEIEAICQSLESVFAALQNEKIDLSPTLFDLFHQAVGNLGNLLSNIETERTASEKSKIVLLTRRLESVLKYIPLSNQQSEVEKIESKDITSIPEKQLRTETARISTAKLDSLLLQTEEMLSIKLTTAHRSIELQEINELFGLWKKEWTKIQTDIRNTSNSNTTALMEFSDWNNTYIKVLENKLTTITKSAENDRRAIGGMLDNLLRNMKTLVMLPISSILEIFPKIVRDLSRDQEKEVEIVIEGAELEVDRRILDEIKTPLIHLVRNSIDHGIESPIERERKQKPSSGKVTISISQKNGNNLEILISDDGTGIDLTKVKQASLKLGIVSEEEINKLSQQELLSLVFYSGVSTNPIITDISGRGLGLAIVREKIERLGGNILLESIQEIGTFFRILLPITLATFRGVLIKANENLFIVPTLNIERVARINKNDIKTVENKETIRLDGQTISFVQLSDVLELPQRVKQNENSKFIFVLVLSNKEKVVAFGVDQILNEQEVLVKGLGKQLVRVRNIASATVLGTGKVVPILNVGDLIKSAVKISVNSFIKVEVLTEKAKRKSILVAEDSITARTLVKNILESAGYYVKTAVDGMEAFTMLKTESFNLVISDVDMPRMSGFDLTAKIRADKKLSDLPVILVTALGKREDRERGIDVGANAYIVKSSFDQSNLLEIIQRFI